MADLIIGGNTYKNIDYIRIQREDGTIATFIDASRRDYQLPCAGLVCTYGQPLIALSAIASSRQASAVWTAMVGPALITIPAVAPNSRQASASITLVEMKGE